MEGEKEQRLSRTMINFEDRGIVISASELRSIEKVHRYVEKPSTHLEHGIAVNRGISGSGVSKTDVYLWYLKEEKRNEVWERMLEILSEEGINLINI